MGLQMARLVQNCFTKCRS
uniref:Uncharacterized protein n=1 Tax=Anguilla anguilla TaxID=7936 RepID=A0A0E9TJG2_ANGAN